MASKNFLSRPQYQGNNLVAVNDYSTTTTFGVVKTSVAPVSSSNPIAVGDNDPRVTNRIMWSMLTMGG